jgi:hypothetical protein
MALIGVQLCPEGMGSPESDVPRMAWRGPRTPTDPLLNNHHWRVTIRNHWKMLRLPCARCGRAIDYDGEYYLRTITGRRIKNPRYLVIGHIVDRYVAKRYGWTESEINALTNTRPECMGCSNKSGARLGQKVQRSKIAAAQRIDTARRW